MRVDSSIPNILIQDQNPNGLVVLGQVLGAPSFVAMTAGKFAVGCELTDPAGVHWTNTGTVAVPSWQTASVLPSHIVKYAGKHTTIGGSAAETFTVSGVLATDLVMCQTSTFGASPVPVIGASTGTNSITVTFLADPSNDHVISYLVYRAAS